NLEWAVVFLMLFARRLLTRPWGSVDYSLIVYATLASLVYATLEYEHINFVSRRIHLLSIIAAVVLNVWLLMEFVKNRNRDALVLGLSLIGVVALGINDLIRHSAPVDSTQWQTPFYLLQFGAPLMFVILTSYLISRYSAAQRNTAQAMQREQQARSQERDRIYQDLHDDVGAKLLTLVYRASGKEEAGIAREALADIRDIVAQRPTEEQKLRDALEPLFAECEDRCESAGLSHHINLVIPKDQSVSAVLTYHLKKIVRELLSNTLRHANADHVEIRCVCSSTELQLRFTDDGVGIAESAIPGRGLAGIRRRVLELGGACDMPNEASGFLCAIHLPLAPKDP
ncbi:MAG: ATP-binding protein, partial [Pseudomonadota bacterium]